MKGRYDIRIQNIRGLRLFTKTTQGLAVCLLCLFAVTQHSAAQQAATAVISGRVVSEQGEFPLMGAHVVWSDNNAGTVTDANGHFRLRVGTGNGVLSVSFIGYQSFRKKLDLKKNEEVFLNIRLKDTVLLSSEVQITGERNRSNTELTQRVHTISPEEIELAPVSGIPALLDYTPGISVSNMAGIFSSKAVVSMRGLPSNEQSRTLVILDGVALNKSDAGSVNWNMIDRNEISSIRTIKGPGPARYGSGAMGGVIEMRSKLPEKKLEGSIMADYGTYNTIGSGLSLRGRSGKADSRSRYYWGVTGAARKSDGYITEPTQFLTMADSILRPVFLKEINTQVKAGYERGKSFRTEIQAAYYDDMRGNGVQVFDDYGAYQKHRTLRTQLIMSGKTGAFELNGNIYNLSERYQRMYEYLSDGEYKLYQADAERQDAGANISASYLKIRQHNITAGFSLRLGSVDGADTYYTSTDIVTNKGKMDQWSVFIQDEATFFGNRLSVNAGIRYDRAVFHGGFFSIDQPSYSIQFYSEFEDRNMSRKQWDALSPRISVGYRHSERLRLYVSAGEGFRAPVLDDMCRTGKKKGGFMVANPDLQPERLFAREIGADITLFGRLSISPSLFYNTGRDFMYYVSNGDTVNMGYKLANVVEKRNIGKVSIAGAEAEIRYELKQAWSFFVNYTYTYAKIAEYEMSNPLADSNLRGKFLTDIPDHKVNAGMTWRNRIVNTTLLFRYTGRVWINDMNQVPLEDFSTARYPDYGTFSVKFERSFFGSLSAGLSIENIFDKIYFDSNLVKCPGRYITVSLRYDFGSGRK